MANPMTDARRSLIRAKESAMKRLEELDDERREIKASLKSLDAALKALGRSNRAKETNPPVAVDNGHPQGAADRPRDSCPKTSSADVSRIEPPNNERIRIRKSTD